MSYKSYPRRSPGRRRAYSTPAPRRGRAKENIHPSRFIKAAQVTQATVYQPKHAFSDFAISTLLHNNLQAKGITMPTPIQDKSIPIALTGQDIIGIANTGTGKTMAFAVPLLHKLMTNSNAKALIMAPTRELAQQIDAECYAISKGSGLRGAVLVGGTSMGPQVRDLRARPRIVIGTPGRIKDHMQRRNLDLADFNLVVLDEVDRMLDMGFVHDMRTILASVNEKRQSYFFSATLSPKINQLIQEFSREPITISVKTGDTTDSVEQNVVGYATKEDKISKLHDLLIGNVSKALVFDETKRSVEKLSKELQARGFQADAIHGGKSQGQRQRALQKFKSNQINILVATDVAARGIDVADISHVINYSTPQSYDDYTHRIGRAGRAGKTGQALTFIES